MIDFERLVKDIFEAPFSPLPHDASACFECKYHSMTNPDNDGYCYMFKDEPATLCMQFQKIHMKGTA